MQTPKQADLIIHAGTLLTMDIAMRSLENCDIAITDGKISAIFPHGSQPWQAAQYLDASDCLVIPGLINAHSHLSMSYFRGLADDLPLDIWLQKYIWPMEAKILSPQVIYDAALHGACEMLKNGITMTHDMYFEPPAIADACSKAGIRAVIGEAVLDVRLSPDWDPISQIKELKSLYASDPLIDFDLPPHAIYTCSQATLEKCLNAARELGLILHIHLSETHQEVQDCLAKHGMRPAEYLHKLGMLGKKTVLAHGVWLDESEMDLLAEYDASIASCPDSNLKLASGILPLKALIQRGVNVCLGTDGVASNNDLDLIAELGNCARLHKAINQDPSFLNAAQALRMVTINAAQALGVAERRGSIEPGKDADICILSLQELQCQPMYNPYSQLVYAMNSRLVRDVVVAGRIVVQNGKLTQVDEAEIIHKAKAYGKRILKELQS